jgi:hypothetical protein
VQGNPTTPRDQFCGRGCAPRSASI